MPVGAMARVDAKMRGPGISPRSTACFTSTSAYIAPSVSRSRIVVNPCSSAILAFRAARIARYGVDWYSRDRKSTRLNSSHGYISYAVFCLKKKKKQNITSKCTQLEKVEEDRAEVSMLEI